MSADPIPVQPPQNVQLPKPGMSRTQKLLFFLTAWLICLMPFLFWWNTWFGRKLTDQQLNEYLHDAKKPRHIQQALVQVGERITRRDATAKQWYPDLVHLAAAPVEEVRNTDAWVMGQDTTGAGFEDAQRSIADGSWQCGTLAGALRRCQWPSADCDAAAARGNYCSRIGTNCRCRPPRHRDPSGRIDCEAAIRP